MVLVRNWLSISPAENALEATLFTDRSSCIASMRWQLESAFSLDGSIVRGSTKNSSLVVNGVSGLWIVK